MWKQREQSPPESMSGQGQRQTLPSHDKRALKLAMQKNYILKLLTIGYHTTSATAVPSNLVPALIYLLKWNESQSSRISSHVSPSWRVRYCPSYPSFKVIHSLASPPNYLQVAGPSNWLAEFFTSCMISGSFETSPFMTPLIDICTSNNKKISSLKTLPDVTWGSPPYISKYFLQIYFSSVSNNSTKQQSYWIYTVKAACYAGRRVSSNTAPRHHTAEPVSKSRHWYVLRPDVLILRSIEESGLSPTQCSDHCSLYHVPQW